MDVASMVSTIVSIMFSCAKCFLATNEEQALGLDRPVK